MHCYGRERERSAAESRMEDREQRLMELPCYDVTADREEGIHQRVCLAARDGLSMLLFLLLNNCQPHKLPVLLNSPIEIDGVRFTPLIAASRNGHDDAVKILLEKFINHVDLEVEATVRIEEYVIDGATALWAAAGAGHLKIVKRLAKAGAQLDHATHSLSTPLRAACFDGRLDIVRFLVQRGASIHLPNQFNNTCLMIAAYKGHQDIVTFLLDKGAKVEDRAQCGATALHFAAESGHTAVVKILLDRGAKLVPNENGMTALICAAERTRSAVVEMLVERSEVTREHAIEAMELLGASFANDKEHYCLLSAYDFLKKSMEMRLGSAEKETIPRLPSPPIPAYNNWQECTSLEQLMGIRDDAAALHMEGLAIRERILGRSCPELPHPIVFRGAVFADDARFDRCLSLWWHALELRQENNVSVFKDLLRFAQVFSQMLHIGIELPFTQIVQILQACALELKRNRDRLDNPGKKDDVDALHEEYESNIRTTLYLITIIATLLDASEKGTIIGRCINSPEEIKASKCAIYWVIKPNPRIRDRQTLLHLALNPNMPVDDFHTNDICKFPCFLTCRLLLQCGADANAQDLNKNTPLHYLARSSAGICSEDIPFDAYNNMVNDLLLYGAHFDTVNIEGFTPSDLSQPGPVEAVLKKIWQGRLACLAAQAISRHGLSYRGLVPTHLHSFIQLHGHLG